MTEVSGRIRASGAMAASRPLIVPFVSQLIEVGGDLLGRAPPQAGELAVRTPAALPECDGPVFLHPDTEPVTRVSVDGSCHRLRQRELVLGAQADALDDGRDGGCGHGRTISQEVRRSSNGATAPGSVARGPTTHGGRTDSHHDRSHIDARFSRHGRQADLVIAALEGELPPRRARAGRADDPGLHCSTARQVLSAVSLRVGRTPTSWSCCSGCGPRARTWSR